MTPQITVAIPCYNEAVTIGKVVTDFQTVLPDARVVVYDNNSTDGSPALARQVGASVRHVRAQGKGHVLRAIFDDFSGQALLIVDGDDTYFADDAPKLLEPILDGTADMVVGNRLPGASDASMVRLHQFGNWLIVRAINRMFRSQFHDILSGYRAFSPHFVASVAVLGAGFEVETEITLTALEENLTVVELPTSYRRRPAGSHSKLNSFRDGFRIMLTAAALLRDHRPMSLYGLGSGLSLLVVGVAAVLRTLNYLGLTALPEAMLTGLILLFAPIAVMLFGIGLMLQTINARFRQLKQIMQRTNPPHDRQRH